MVPPLADATNKVKHVAVPSRFAAPSKPGGSGMPCLKTQVEQLKAEALRSAASEAFAIEQRKVAAARASALRLELGRADEDLSTSHCAALEAQCRAAELQRRVNLLEAEGEQQRRRAEAMQDRIAELERANAVLGVQLAEVHDAVASARDVQLPAAARRAERERQRAEEHEEHARRLRRRLDARNATLREVGEHFERLRGAVAPADDATLDALAQSALASFGTLYVERSWHTDARFAALQDVIVRLAMKAGELSQWLPWWLASRTAEAAAREQEMREEEEAMATRMDDAVGAPTADLGGSARGSASQRHVAPPLPKPPPSAMAAPTTAPTTAPRVAPTAPPSAMAAGLPTPCKGVALGDAEGESSIALSPELSSADGRPGPSSRVLNGEGSLTFEGLF